MRGWRYNLVPQRDAPLSDYVALISPTGFDENECNSALAPRRGEGSVTSEPSRRCSGQLTQTVAFTRRSFGKPHVQSLDNAPDGLSAGDP